MSLEDIKREYETQETRFTAFPIYVTVQELVCIGVMADGYSVNCPFGDGVNKTEYKHEGFDGTYEDRNALVEEIKEYYPQESKKIIEQIEEINVGYIWTPVEFFMTIKGAKEYMKANAHNHGELRTYVHHFERRNFEMRELLKEIGFKVKD